MSAEPGEAAKLYVANLRKDSRIAELESALRGLLERTERVGGYATTDDQLALWRAKQALQGAKT